MRKRAQAHVASAGKQKADLEKRIERDTPCASAEGGIVQDVAAGEDEAEKLPQPLRVSKLEAGLA